MCLPWSRPFSYRFLEKQEIKRARRMSAIKPMPFFAFLIVDRVKGRWNRLLRSPLSEQLCWFPSYELKEPRHKLSHRLPIGREASQGLDDRRKLLDDESISSSVL